MPLVQSKLLKEFVYHTDDANHFWDKYTELFDKKYNLKRSRVKQEVFKHCLGNASKVSKEFDYIAQTSLVDGLSNIIAYQMEHKE